MSKHRKNKISDGEKIDEYLEQTNKGGKKLRDQMSKRSPEEMQFIRLSEENHKGGRKL